MRPEQPARVLLPAAHLKSAHPNWHWSQPTAAKDPDLLRAHSKEHLTRLARGPDFDDDTPYFTDIEKHARRAVGAAIDTSLLALASKKSFSLMRPPGHHALRTHAMGFCYLNNIAVAALHAREAGVERIAIWDFDAHHGNGTEAILHKVEGVLFSSVHQYPGYPGTGMSSFDNCHNFVVPPHASRELHMAALEQSLRVITAFRPTLLLVSAGFDAYAADPITSMSLEIEDFASLGKWLGQLNLPTAALLEGGYSPKLPLLIDSFLTAWQGTD